MTAVSKPKRKGISVSFYLLPHTVKQLKQLSKIYDMTASRILERVINEAFEKDKQKC